MFIITNEFRDGYTLYKRTYKRNSKLVEWTLDYIIKKQDKIYHKEYKQSVKEKKWVGIKKLKKIEKYVIKEIKVRLKLHLEKEFKLTSFENP